MTQIKNKKKRLFSKNFTSVLTTAREKPKNKGKNPDKMCQLIFLKIYPQCLLGMLSHIGNFTIPMNECPN